MRKNPMKFVLAAALTGSLALLALPARAGVAEENQTSLSISETAERTLRQDRLNANLRVEAKGADPAQLQKDVNGRMAAAVERAKKQSDVKVSTGSYWIYEEQTPKGGRTWRAMQDLQLTSVKPELLLTLAGDLQAKGLLLSGLSYDLSPEAEKAVRGELTKQAVGELRRRAAEIASAMDMKVAGFKAIRVGGAGEQTPRVMAMAASRLDKAEVGNVPVAEAGETTVRLTVEADILLD